jgi:hypothetical protein
MTDIKLPPLPEWAKMDNLNGMVPSEIRTALNEFGREAVRLNTQAAPAAQQPLTDEWPVRPAECGVCGLRLDQVMGYVCNNQNCVVFPQVTCSTKGLTP